jgi:hypothetical protein
MNGAYAMKRVILAFSCLLCLGLGSLPASAQGPQGAGVEGKKVKTHWHWWHHEKHAKKGKTAPLYASPKSVGWWHRSPGPMGAGTK